MSAPTPTARQAPTGWKMPDGFKTLVTFATVPAIGLWERDVKPPGIDGGDKIDTTTMHNNVWRTFAARKLKTLTEATFKCAYDPDSYTALLGLVNFETTLTFTYPDHSTLAFFGFMQKFEPDELKEGDFPMATVTITPINADPAAGYAEAAPVFAAAPGT